MAQPVNIYAIKNKDGNWFRSSSLSGYKTWVKDSKAASYYGRLSTAKAIAKRHEKVLAEVVTLKIEKSNKSLDKMAKDFVSISGHGDRWDILIGKKYILCHHASKNAAKYCRDMFLEEWSKLWNGGEVNEGSVWEDKAPLAAPPFRYEPDGL